MKGVYVDTEALIAETLVDWGIICMDLTLSMINCSPNLHLNRNFSISPTDRDLKDLKVDIVGSLN